MKKQKFRFMVIVIICIIIHTGCMAKGDDEEEYFVSEQQESSIRSENETEESITSSIQETESETNQIETQILPDGFEELSLIQFTELYNLFGEKAEEEMANPSFLVLRDIGVKKLKEVVWGNYKNSSTESFKDITIEYFAVTEKRNIIIGISYIIDEWSVLFVKDADTGNYYYVPEELKDTIDLYDYSTGELISQKSKSHDDVQKEINDQLEKEEESFESELNEIKDEYIDNQNNKNSSKVSELTFDGESIIDVAVRDMKEYEYIKDVYIEIDESEKQINIVVQIPLETDANTGRMAGEDVARYLASLASWSSESYSGPSSDDLGGIYNKYDLLIYVDDGNHSFDIYGAKVMAARKITWR